MSDEVNLSRISESLPQCLTGADLYSVCYNAWQNAARREIKFLESGKVFCFVLYLFEP